MNKPEIRFYHLQKVTLHQALPKLLEKIYAKGMKTKVLLADPEDVKTLDQRLWTYGSQSFLPHGCTPDHYAEDQPIWLTTDDDNPNQADVLVACHSFEPKENHTHQIICFIFDETNPDNLNQARDRWHLYSQQQDYKVSYWQQDEKGAWEQRH